MDSKLPIAPMLRSLPPIILTSKNGDCAHCPLLGSIVACGIEGKAAFILNEPDDELEDELDDEEDDEEEDDDDEEVDELDEVDDAEENDDDDDDFPVDNDAER